MSPRARAVLLIGVFAFAVLAVRLGFWQLHRLAQRRAANAAALVARDAPELDVAARNDQPLAGRRVRASGTYDRGHELVLRGQVFREIPGIILVTPLRLSALGDTAVLVERGFVPSPDAVTIPGRAASLNEPGAQSVRGMALPLTAAPDSGAPLEHEGQTTWRRLDLSALRARLPYPILDVAIRQAPDSILPQMPRRLDPPSLDEGPHLSYAIQWFAFAVIAVGFAVAVLVRGKR
jgi:surfeit locus 1 family protein